MAEELSLIINNPGEGNFLKRIDWNKEQYMEVTKSITEQYKGLVYTEEQMSEAKKDRAELNKMKKGISGRRIEIKNAVMEPYTQFEKEVKEITDLIDETIDMIDVQIKGYEENLKNEKKKALEEYFVEVGKPLEGFITLEKIFDAQWLNKTTSLKKAKEELAAKVEKIVTDLNSIENLCDEKYQAILRDYYSKTLSISKTIGEHGRLKELDRKREEEKKARELEERMKAEQEAREKAELEAKKEEVASTVAALGTASYEETREAIDSMVKQNSEQTEAVAETPEPEQAVDPFVQPQKKYKASFTVYGTKEQILALKQYLKDNNIRFEK